MVGAAFVVLGVASALVVFASVTPALARAVVRLPAGGRRWAVRHAAQVRATQALVWVLAWIAMFLGMTRTTSSRPAVSVAVGIGFGALFAFAGDSAARRLFDEWRGEQFCSESGFRLPALRDLVGAADLPPPDFEPSLPQLVQLSRGADAPMRLDRALRWIRNGAAVGLVAAIWVARGWQVSHDTGGAVSPAVYAAGLCAVTLISSLMLQGVRGHIWDMRARRRAGGHLSVERICAVHGWQLQRPGPTALTRRWPALPFLKHDKEHYLPLAIQATVNQHRFYWVEERGSRRTSLDLMTRGKQQTLCIAWLPNVDLPRLAIAGRDTRRVTEQVQNHGLELEQFNRRFHIQCADSRFVSGLLAPRMMEHLLTSLPDGSTLTTAGDAIALVTPGRLRAWQIEHQMQFLSRAVSLLPSYLLRDRQVSASSATRLSAPTH